MPKFQPLTYLTDDMPGIDGVIRQRREDFFVEEQPLYEPYGEGEHLYLFVEKCGQTTSDIIRRVAKMFSVRRRDIGYAGLKDKHAITRQHLSVYLPDRSNDEKFLSRFEFTPMKLIWSQRHINKLRRGHLRANRFIIYIRNIDPASVVDAKQILDHLIQTGLPNYVGHQRFGYRGTNHELGRLLLLCRWQELLDLLLGGPKPTDAEATRTGREFYDQGDYSAALEVWPKHLRHDRQALDHLRQGRLPKEAVMGIDRQQRGFLISALQSEIFNHVLDQRIRAGLFRQLIAGDLGWKHENHSVFSVDQETATKDNGSGGRVENLEVSPSGPMWGAKMLQASGQVRTWETEAMHDFKISEQDFNCIDHIDAKGTRRPLRVTVDQADISSGADDHGPYVRLAFDLPRGAFATTLLREIMKNKNIDSPASPAANRSKQL